MQRIRPFFQSLWPLGALLCSAACGQQVTLYDKPDYAPKVRQIGHIDFTDSERNTTRLELHKIEKGYALKAPIHKSESERTRTDFVISRNKEYKTYAGFRLSYEF